MIWRSHATTKVIYFYLFFIGCPWKGPLSELKRHLNVCFFDEKKLPEHMKTQLKENSVTREFNLKKMVEEENEDNSNKYLEFNKDASLKARLYQKNPLLINRALNNNSLEKENKDDDLLDYLGVTLHSSNKEILPNIGNSDSKSSNSNLTMNLNSTLNNTITPNDVEEEVKSTENTNLIGRKRHSKKFYSDNIRAGNK
jgi:hypothetical protein